MAKAKKKTGSGRSAPAKKAPAKKSPARKVPAKTAPAGRASVAQKTDAASKAQSRKSNVWDYIKKNSLQDKVKRTTINADAKLKP